MESKRILLIDDDSSFCQMIQEILATTSCQLTATTDYREGLRRAMTDHPDLIMLDIHMPEVSGLDLIKQLRNMQSTRHIPVMMVTGDDRMESVHAARQYNAVSYLLKPFKPLYLLERLGQIFGSELISSMQQASLQAQSHDTPTPPVNYRVKTKTLLVIDDEAIIAHLIGDILEDSMLKIESATHAREGLRLAMTSPVDVILMDAHMPEITGLEATEQLKKMRSTRDVPVILMSGQAPEHLEEQARQIGAVDFLAKPFSPGDLIYCLQKALHKEIFWS